MGLTEGFPMSIFDRILVCQSIVHGMTILTPDEAISQYAVRVVW